MEWLMVGGEVSPFLAGMTISLGTYVAGLMLGAFLSGYCDRDTPLVYAAGWPALVVGAPVVGVFRALEWAGRWLRRLRR